MKKNPSGGEMALLAGGAVAAVYFWPQISAMFSGTPAPVTGAPVTVPGGASVTATGPLPSGAPASALIINPANSLPRLTTNAPPPPPGYSTMTTLSGVPAAPTRSAALVAQAALNSMLAEPSPQVTNNSPIGPWTPGATQLPGGCWSYGNTPVLANCPPGTPAPVGRDPGGNCQPGFSLDANGKCSNTASQYNMATLNSTPYTGSIPNTPLNLALLGNYIASVGVTPGSVLAAILNLPPNPAQGTMSHGKDGFTYLAVNGIWIREGTATQLTRPTGPIGPRPAALPAGTRLQGLGAAAAAVPITNATLIAASNDPQIAALLGNDPRAMLTIAQWNYFYSQATGVMQVTPPYPEVEPNSLISAAQYQSWRVSAGLSPAPATKLGIIRRSRPGAFPLGGIHPGPNRLPFIQPGNHNAYRIPGRGLARLGLIQAGGGDHRYSRSPFPRPTWWRQAE